MSLAPSMPLKLPDTKVFTSPAMRSSVALAVRFTRLDSQLLAKMERQLRAWCVRALVYLGKPARSAYLTDATGKQGKSGLGIEAQRDAIARFAATEGLTILAEFVEIEIGKGADALDRRPQLAAALAAARKAKSPVVVAKLCRLSRDVAFISGLMAA